MKKTKVVLLIFLILVTVYIFYQKGQFKRLHYYFFVKQTVEDAINKYGNQSEQRLVLYFKKAKLSYPPTELTLLAIKDKKTLEVWAKNYHYQFIREYPIKAASGILGPKLIEGDGQVPEGIYRIIGLNPNSSFHLSMKLNYPNEFDLKYAKLEERTSPGTNIFIHGNAVSIGCLAIGDPAIEELFTLVHKVGKSNVKVIIAPSDPRKIPLIPADNHSDWVKILYQNISKAYEPFKKA